MRFIDIGTPADGEGTNQHHLRLGAAVLVAAALLLGLAFAWYQFILPPRPFPTNVIISIPDDASVGEMGRALEDAGAIRSPFLFRAYARVTFQDRDLASGLYVFDRPLGLVRVTHRLATADHGIEPVRVTLTEGMTVEEMGEALALEVPNFDTEAFLRMSSTSEGYLFPDTYFFMPNTAAEEVFLRLRQHFDEKVAEIEEQVTAFGRPLAEVVTMASLLEREAQSEEDMRIIAGILWKRLAAQMPLQVDAPFGYVQGVSGYTPTASDLASDSPFNTYRNTGLTPTPIANPGLVALRAAVTPIETEYLYYLTGRDGLMHYGRTFEEHKENRRLYLD